MKFPKGFLWGAATSAYQVEGGIENNDWAQVFPAGRACDQYNRYEKDFELIQKMNHNAHRLSLEWSRIEPERGKFDEDEIQHYKKVLRALKSRNITTFVTLWHWTNPVWFTAQGGWGKGKNTPYFLEYVEYVVEELGEFVDYWVTLNEPMNHASLGYVTGAFPPQKKNPFKAIGVVHSLVAAHRLSYDIIHEKYPEAKVSISQILNYFEAARSWFPLEQFIAAAAHFFWNHYFLLLCKSKLDYIGFSYYFHNRIIWKPPFVENKNKKVSDLGWEIYPEGIYHVLKHLKRFNKPLYILENGLADAKDAQRTEFITEHLKWIHKAIEEGVDVKGYFHWSLLDNFEWKEGTKPRFGLVAMDYKTMKRTPRESANFYAEIAKNNSVTI